VKVKTVKGEKEGHTGYGCISAGREKRRFWILARGKIDVCHAKFKAPDDVFVRQTQSGSTNEDMMLQ
jgi:hypothetical protein